MRAIAIRILAGLPSFRTRRNIAKLIYFNKLMSFGSGFFVYDIMKYRWDKCIKELLGGIKTVCLCTEVVYLLIFYSFMDDLSDTAF